MLFFLKLIWGIAMVFALSALYLFFNTAQSLTWEIRHPCLDTIDEHGEYQTDIEKLSVGDITIAILKQKNIPFVGDASGIASIKDTPAGQQAIQTFEDGRIRAFGWCYSVDGITPDLMPGDYKFPHKNSKLVWWYGFSTLTNGDWIGYCDPSHLANWEFLCEPRSVKTPK